MSRTAAFMFLLAAATPLAAREPANLEAYQRLTRVAPRCGHPASSTEITVCGNRRADRWRVPFIGYEAGDPRGETVSGERNRLASAPKLPCGIGAILAGCGSVGLSVSSTFASGKLKLRPLVP
jgi:hypothetical protein